MPFDLTSGSYSIVASSCWLLILRRIHEKAFRIKSEIGTSSHSILPESLVGDSFT